MFFPLLCLSLKEMEQYFLKMGEPAFRAKQVFHWFYERFEADFFKMTNLKKKLREKLNEMAGVQTLELLETKKSKLDNSEKFLFKLKDGEKIETVKMPQKRGITFCLSTQCGCPLKCSFCLTGKRAGRNLKTHEIFGSFLSMANGLSSKRINIVFMGMGEPLLNLENIKKVLPFFYISISPRRITVSTAGLLKEIRELGKIHPHPRLAISLNAGTDKTRKKLMPFHNYKITELIEEIKNYPKRAGERATIEYVLIKNENDGDEEIENLKKLLNPIRNIIKINFIPYNPVKSIQYEPTDEERINKIMDYFSKNNFNVTLRRSKGSDISAACGQLNAEYKI